MPLQGSYWSLPTTNHCILTLSGYLTDSAMNCFTSRLLNLLQCERVLTSVSPVAMYSCLKWCLEVSFHGDYVHAFSMTLMRADGLGLLFPPFFFLVTKVSCLIMCKGNCRLNKESLSKHHFCLFGRIVLSRLYRCAHHSLFRTPTHPYTHTHTLSLKHTSNTNCQFETVWTITII